MYDTSEFQDTYKNGEVVLVSCADFSYPTMNRVSTQAPFYDENPQFGKIIPQFAKNQF